MKRTYIVFENRSKRDKALDYLTKTKVKFYGNVCKDIHLPCWLSFSPSAYKKNCIDLYLNGLFYNSFSKIK